MLEMTPSPATKTGGCGDCGGALPCHLAGGKADAVRGGSPLDGVRGRSPLVKNVKKMDSG